MEDYTRYRIIGKSEEVSGVNKDFGTAHSIASRSCREFETTETAVSEFIVVVLKIITAPEDLCLVLQARKKRRQAAK